MGQVFIPDALLAEARQQGLDLETELAGLVRRRIACKDAEAWLAENREAVDAYNADVAENGLPLDEYRLF